MTVARESTDTKCRICSSKNVLQVLDLGNAPLSNQYLESQASTNLQTKYPLQVLFCEPCNFYQVRDVTSREEIFTAEYAYFSSYSKDWLVHCEEFADKVLGEIATQEGYFLELASNDGYLLKIFKERGAQTLGVEPTASTARAALESDIETIVDFFGSELSEEILKQFGRPKVVIANNVLAHVPDPIDFLKGVHNLLNSNSIFSFEVPHAIELLQAAALDTVYHEHYSYFTLHSIVIALEKSGMKLLSAIPISTHGGSLRVTAVSEKSSILRSWDEDRSQDILALEKFLTPEAGKIGTLLQGYAMEASGRLSRLLNYLRGSGDVYGFGAAAKANTLLNFSGVKPDQIAAVADSNPQKIGRFMPGSGIPIISASDLFQANPENVIVLAWNWKDEIAKSLIQSGYQGEIWVTMPEISRFSNNGWIKERHV